MAVAEDDDQPVISEQPDARKPAPARAGHERRRWRGAGDGLGDNAYGTGEFQERLDQAGIDSRCKSQRPTAAGGLFTKDDFTVDLGADAVTCPTGHTVPIRRGRGGAGMACFGAVCAGCPLQARCTQPAAGEPSAWVSMSRRWPAPVSGRPRQAGRPTTGPPGPRSNVSSRT